MSLPPWWLACPNRLVIVQWTFGCPNKAPSAAQIKPTEPPKMAHDKIATPFFRTFRLLLKASWGILVPHGASGWQSWPTSGGPRARGTRARGTKARGAARPGQPAAGQGGPLAKRGPRAKARAGLGGASQQKNKELQNVC